MFFTQVARKSCAKIGTTLAATLIKTLLCQCTFWTKNDNIARNIGTALPATLYQSCINVLHTTLKSSNIEPMVAKYCLKFDFKLSYFDFYMQLKDINTIKFTIKFNKFNNKTIIIYEIKKKICIIK